MCIEEKSKLVEEAGMYSVLVRRERGWVPIMTSKKKESAEYVQKYINTHNG